MTKRSDNQHRRRSDQEPTASTGYAKVNSKSKTFRRYSGAWGGRIRESKLTLSSAWGICPLIFLPLESSSDKTSTNLKPQRRWLAAQPSFLWGGGHAPVWQQPASPCLAAPRWSTIQNSALQFPYDTIVHTCLLLIKDGSGYEALKTNLVTSQGWNQTHSESRAALEILRQ